MIEDEREVSDQVPWGVVDAATGIFLLLPVSILVGVAMGLFGVFVSFLAGVRPPEYLVIVSFGGATFFAGTGLSWWLGIHRRGGDLTDLGFTNVRLWLDPVLAGMGEIIVWVGLAAYGLVLLKLAGQKVPEQPIVQMFGRSSLGFVLAVVFVAILGPIGEEVFFRGFVYTAFRGRWGVRIAMVASSAIFALFHVVPLLYVPMFMMGLIFSALFEHRRSLAPNIMMHVLNNFAALLVLYSRVK